MSRYGDPWEEQRLRDENKYLYEQVRTLSAALADKHRAHWRIIKNGEVSVRPPHKTAAARALLTDEAVEFDADDSAIVHVFRGARRRIEDLAKFSPALDHIWRITVERDYAA